MKKNALIIMGIIALYGIVLVLSLLIVDMRGIGISPTHSQIQNRAQLGGGTLAPSTAVAQEEVELMTGMVNVVVADFAPTEEGAGVAQIIYEDVQNKVYNAFNFSSQDIQFERYNTTLTATEACTLAHRINATLVVWGEPVPNSQHSYQPHFLMHHPAEGATPIAEHFANLPISKNKWLEQSVRQRTTILVVFAKGLSHFLSTPAQPHDATLEFSRAIKLMHELEEGIGGGPDGIEDRLLYWKSLSLEAEGKHEESVAAYQQSIALKAGYTYPKHSILCPYAPATELQ